MSWEQLQSIMDTNKQTRRQERNDPPVACPFDGELLDVRPDGVRNCPLGNYQYPRDGRLL